MKKIFILALSSFITIKGVAQDSAVIKGLQLQTKLIEYLTPVIMNPSNDSLFQVYIDLRPKFRIQNPPSNNQLVTIDSIPTVELANLYNYTLSNSEGFGMNNNMKTQIAAARTSNNYLNTLCTGYETFWNDRLTALRNAGRKLLRGK